MHTLHRFDRSSKVITAPRTSDLLRWKRFRDVSELRWKETASAPAIAGKIAITAFRVRRRDTYRGYNGYVLEGNNRRIIFSGDTALCDSFAELRTLGPIDLAIMPIGAYNPWISFALHSGTGRANGQRSRRPFRYAGSPSNFPAEQRKLP